MDRSTRDADTCSCFWSAPFLENARGINITGEVDLVQEVIRIVASVCYISFYARFCY